MVFTVPVPWMNSDQASAWWMPEVRSISRDFTSCTFSQEARTRAAPIRI